MGTRKKAVKKEIIELKVEPSSIISSPDRQGFPIVGIGASAGGLAAFEAFFSGMPKDTDPGMAFVLVQHLAPDHKSILTDLIRRYTRMQVFEVEDGMPVKPNCAYIIPPNRDMAFLNGTLQLLEPSAPRGQRMPIDFFFRSLAQDQHERAICVVLSGTGNDGTQGVRTIKGEGGMVMVQDPASTEYDGMPRSAIATGLVDYELPPTKMPAQIIAYVAQTFGKLPQLSTRSTYRAENTLKKISILLRMYTGHDFSQYKPSTLTRRIERRMAVHQIETMPQYIQYLRQTPAEVDALFRDLLIGVTNLFRDPEAFKIIEEQVIPKLFIGKPKESVIRVWVPGCSTGEEAYSIAILLQEHLEKLKQNNKIQVFATDIDSQAIAIARVGVYPASIVSDISPERLARFFTAEPGGSAYRIHKIIRDGMVFSEQDVIKDPPFSKLDLISCRNLLIYMNADLQKKIIPLIYCSLNPGGFLFLGTSETVGEFTDLFSPLSRKWKIFQRQENINGFRRMTQNRYIPPLTTPDVRSPGDITRKAFLKKLPLREFTEKALLKQVAPAAALVDGHGDILYLHGRTGKYLEPAPGEAGTSNILKMSREGLQNALSVALRKAVIGKEIVHQTGLRVKTNGDFTQVNLTVLPVEESRGETSEPPLYLIILGENYKQSQQAVSSSEIETESPVDSPDLDSSDASLASLKRQLRDKEEYLRTTTEELETANEELKSSNEEMQSVNEELQSTNEELETSKEELQSVNEELATVNTELQTKVTELGRANNDMNNLLSGTGIATIFVDRQLRILRFTPTATLIINLIQSDIGRPIDHILSKLMGYNQLRDDIQAVLNTLVPQAKEVQTGDSRWYSVRIQPYRTLDNVIEGAVISFIDVNDLKKAEKQRELSNKVLQNLNQGGEKKELIRNLLRLFKAESQFEALGIRLREGGDYPYFEANGFPAEHITHENSLCVADAKGNIPRDSQGNPLLECMCGNIIRGRFDPKKPFFTAGGSFWTNSTTDLLASTTEVDRQARTRNRCNGEGYESVALIPIKDKNITVGLLQINDTRRDCFTLELIQRYENLAQSIGIALAQKQTEEALTASETKYRDLYENAPAAYFSVGMDGLIKESNKAAQLLFGYSQEEMMGKSRFDLYPAEYAAEARMLFEKIISGISIDQKEMVYQKKDGSKFYGLISITPILDETKQAVAIRSVIEDITERKQAEAKIIELEALKIISQAKSDLLANVSHELRTPLASIKGNIETLIEPDVKWSKRQQLEILQSANKEADRLTLLIKDLLDMSRIDSGKLILDRRIHSIKEILESVSNVLSVVAAKHNLKVVHSPDLPSIEVDKGRIGQVITNLVDNAVKFSAEGSQILIDAAINDGNLIFSIEDRGIGMPPEVVAKLFDRFYQARQIVEGKTRGTGLGLTICKGIVEAHGGKIWVESQPSEGSKFRFSLPIK
jgi:two-component system, chemotaxis family, CheB/CheR fusion protein